MANKNQKFSANGQEFEIRTSQIGEKHLVKIFLNNKQVSPIYSVDLETNSDYFNQHE